MLKKNSQDYQPVLMQKVGLSERGALNNNMKKMIHFKLLTELVHATTRYVFCIHSKKIHKIYAALKICQH